ncbi:hypothetical protein LTR20_010221 [Exophiala xenobiotica]|nr:hypothetical protein LTR40_000942 [Exophiala xenobiotica]KAK5370360.1 hypothetical protein LTS13_006950 [Exophiala xenobiotica]KAK5397382.1 hypothetical protein LTR79_004895 [Exophiala xenobiotica]KAK5410467.1 hypothetical protein LTR90_008648 [Exophiala xenobiotica]KAK5454562.1 hypothetical protein LTR20_010221 [Exophiala xenobiotica]
MGGSAASSNKFPTSEFRYSLHGLPYSQTIASQPPIKVTSSTSLHRTPDDEHNVPLPSPQTGDNASTLSNRNCLINASPQDGDGARITIAGSISPRDSQTSLNTKAPTVSSLTSAAASIPQIRVNNAPDRISDESIEEKRKWSSLNILRSIPMVIGKETVQDTNNASSGFEGVSLDISIPSGGFGDDLSTKSIEFSKRGSMLIDGRRVNQSNNRRSSPMLASIMDEEKKEDGPQTAMSANSNIRAASMPTPAAARNTIKERPSAKVLSADEEMLSEKVRAFYAAGTDTQLETDSTTNLAARMGARWQVSLGADTHSVSIPSLSRATSTTDINEDMDSSRHPSMTASASQTYIIPEREETELAGGLEDWKDVDNADVDRYGFILARAPTVDGADESKPQRLTRVSTSLQQASETPRRRVTLRRTPSTTQGSIRSGHSRHSAADQTPPRPTSSQSGYARTPSRRSGSTRILGPGSKDRRLMDSAMDMLTLPRSAKSVVENGHVHIDDARARRKEIAREEKWRKMSREKAPATDAKTGLPVVGGGSETGYTFNTTSAKLIDRTWKGIPDKWRATAWHSFLSTSALRRQDCLSDADLVELFHHYQTQSSPDDVQIDIDVPRTISAHIMFRRRYRGGQRLLFRVLHAMSLHCPETGYVQGMAALAVTLLAYYDEEKAFVMLVRMWELRGLGELYKSGFGGLMAALNEFERGWLGQGEVARKLEELNIGPTAYGTRWYLTLFNYTIPFPAQLRVWDVFMLLGDDTSSPNTATATTTTTASHTSAASRSPSVSHNSHSQIQQTPTTDADEPHFGTTLDILHASSAALIDGMRDILLESDFENAMKVLTSWIPIQDEDLFMRIARAEWKMHLKHDPAKSGRRVAK